MTYALGWCMAHVPSLMVALASALGLKVPSQKAVVLLQQHGGRHGITDIEVQEPGQRVWIFDAKGGFAGPSTEQLKRYAARLNEVHGLIKERILIVLGQSDHRDLWLRHTMPKTVDSIPIHVLSWRQIRVCLDRAWPMAGHTGKGLLRQLSDFLNEVIDMQIVTSNDVYVVALGRETFGGGTTTFLEVVEKHGKYFHPIRAPWPVSPPNYIGFRNDGRLQSIHHIDDYEIITDFHPYFSDVPSGEHGPHFLYTLGPAIRPAQAVKTGNVYANSRKWAHLDLLLTCATVSEASEKSKKRIEMANWSSGP